MNALTAAFIVFGIIVQGRPAQATVLGKPEDLIRMVHSSDRRERNESIRALADMGSDATGAIITELQTNLHVDRRTKILLTKLLGNTHDAEGDALLTSLLRSDADPLVRQAAAVGMGQSGRRIHLETLRTLVNEKKENLAVRLQAAWALGKLGDGSGKGLALKTISAKSGGDGTPKFLAVEALEAIADDSCLPELDRNWRFESDPWTRILSRVAATRIRYSKIAVADRIEYLRKAISDPQFEVCEWAAQSLEQLGTVEARKVLVETAASPSSPGAYSAQKGRDPGSLTG